MDESFDYVRRIVAPTESFFWIGTPDNGFVTESGLVFYVAEDGTTFYVQEN